MPTVIWSNHKDIGEVMKAPATKLKVQLTAREGIKYANIREFYMKKSDNEWRPGRGGMAIAVEPLKELIKQLQQIVDESESFPLEGNPIIKE